MSYDADETERKRLQEAVAEIAKSLEDKTQPDSAVNSFNGGSPQSAAPGKIDSAELVVLKSPKASCSLLYAIALVGILLFVPDNSLRKANPGWLESLFLFPLFAAAIGYASLFNLRRARNFKAAAKCYTDAFCIMVSGLVALPICLIFRPPFAPLAFVTFLMGAGTVLVFRLQRNRGSESA
jgi:hypothetical protein